MQTQASLKEFGSKLLSNYDSRKVDSLPYKELKRMAKTGDISLASLFALGQELEFDATMFESYNHDLLIKNFNNESFVSECYKKNAKTKLATSRNIVRALDHFYSKLATNKILNMLGVSRSYIENSKDQNISTLLNSDLYLLTTKMLRFNRNHVKNLGELISVVDRESLYADWLEGKTLKKSYEIFFDQISNKVENSYFYKLERINNNGLIFSQHFNPEMLDERNGEVYGNSYVDDFRAGFAGTPFIMKNGTPPKYRVLKNMFDASEGPTGLIEISFS